MAKAQPFRSAAIVTTAPLTKDRDDEADDEEADDEVYDGLRRRWN